MKIHLLLLQKVMLRNVQAKEVKALIVLRAIKYPSVPRSKIDGMQVIMKRLICFSLVSSELKQPASFEFNIEKAY